MGRVAKVLMQHGLTPKQKQFADGLIATGNGTQSALQAYDTTDPMVAAGIAKDNCRKPQIIRYISDRCQAANLTIDRVLGRLSEEIDAERTVQTSTGDVVGTEPDWTARHKAIETSIKYVLPEFHALRSIGGSSNGSSSKHLHLHGVDTSSLMTWAQSGAVGSADNDTETDASDT